MFNHGVSCYHSLIQNPMIKRDSALVCRLHDSILYPDDGPIKKVRFQTGSEVLLLLQVQMGLALKLACVQRFRFLELIQTLKLQKLILTQVSTLVGLLTALQQSRTHSRAYVSKQAMAHLKHYKTTIEEVKSPS